MKKSQKSIAEIEMKEILNECATIVDENYLKTNDAKKIIDAGCKLLEKCKELRLSRDNWKNKYHNCIHIKN